MVRDQEQGGTDDCDTVSVLGVYSWKTLKTLITKMLLQLHVPCHGTCPCMLASTGLNAGSNTGITIDTGRYETAAVTDLDALPAVESTRIGSVSEFEAGTGGPVRVMALP